MAEKKLVPELRFPGFGGEWEEKKLSKLVNIARGKSKYRPRNANILYEDGKYPFVQTGDIKDAGLYLTKFSQKYSEYGLKQSKLWSAGTLCVTIAANIAETAILGIDACFPDSIIGIVPLKNKADVTFIKYQFDKLKNDIQRLSEGVAQDNLNLEKLSNIIFTSPGFKEQEKIASFLSDIDEHIQLLEKKREALERYKKGVMQKIFNREIRFKDDAGKDFPDWDEKRLGEICEKRSSSISANELLNNGGNYKIYGATGFLRNVDFYQEEEPYISIVKDGAGVGRILLCDAKSSVLGTLDIIKPKENINIRFLYAVISAITFEKYTTGSTIPHIYFKDYAKEKVIIPCLSEQQKIASFLSSIDKSIDQVDHQLLRAKEYKKGLLQKMFV